MCEISIARAATPLVKSYSVLELERIVGVMVLMPQSLVTDTMLAETFFLLLLLS